MLSHADLAQAGGRLRMQPALHPAAWPDLLSLAPALPPPARDVVSRKSIIRVA